MKIKYNQGSYKRFFLVPCELTELLLKQTDGPTLKVILYLMSNDSDAVDPDDIRTATGITKLELENALKFWDQYNYVSAIDRKPDDFSIEVIPRDQDSEVVTKKQSVVHSRYTPADIAQMLKDDTMLKNLFKEAEISVGRILKHTDRELIVYLKDYYGFSPMAISTIFAYCNAIRKTSTKYIETVAQDFYDKGVMSYQEIEKEIERLEELHTFERQVFRAFGLQAKLTPKQCEYIKAWKDAGFSIELVGHACDKCIDAINKVQFPYIDKVLKNWQSQNITTPDEADGYKNPPQKIEKSSSFDMDAFDDFSLGFIREKSY